MTTYPHGARPLDADRWEVALWAPVPERVTLVLDGPVHESRPADDATPDGWYRWEIDGVTHGQQYWFEIDGRLRPDPASRWQPHGVAGPSALVDPGTFTWTTTDWQPPTDLRHQVLYELHVGTFTSAGTFDAAIDHLDDLVATGITAIELMPVAQFPGARNWGYDGVLPSAVQDTYGGPAGLARLVDAAHQRGLAVILDVVYNHLGPEGNHLREFGPYFTDTYSTPWGGALNFAEAGSDNVRSYFVESAVGFVRDLRVDGFRLDAVHAIVDPTALPFLEELTAAVHDTAAADGRHALVIAESSDNDPRLVRSSDRGGFGMDGVWHDEIHHAVRVAVTGEREGYYADFTGAPDLARALERNLVFDGTFSAARDRRHGRPSDDVDAYRYVVCDQNHDQVGNRAFGERLDVLVDAAQRRLAAAVVTLGPFTPMLFMGEEYGETAPFPYFVSHTDPELVEAVRRGRRAEFAAFDWQEDPPDPAAIQTFRSAVLDRSRADDGIRELWRALLTARREHPVLHDPTAHATTSTSGHLVVHHRAGGDGEVVVLWNLGQHERETPLPDGEWRVALTTGPDADPTAGSCTCPPWTAMLLVRPT